MVGSFPPSLPPAHFQPFEGWDFIKAGSFRLSHALQTRHLAEERVTSPQQARGCVPKQGKYGSLGNRARGAEQRGRVV